MQTVKMVLDDPADRVNKEVIALAVNLASNLRNAGELSKKKYKYDIIPS